MAEAGYPADHERGPARRAFARSRSPAWDEDRADAGGGSTQPDPRPSPTELGAPDQQAALFACFEALESGVIMLGADRRVRGCNAWIRDRLAASELALPGAILEELFPELCGSRLSQAVTEALELGNTTDLPRDVHGSILPLYDTMADALEPPRLHQDVLIKPVRISDQETGCLIQVRDAGADRAREMAIQEREQRYRAILQDQTDCLVRFKADGTLTYANEVCTQRFNLPAAQLGTLSIFDFLRPTEHSAFKSHLAALNPRMPTAEIEQEFALADGAEPVWMLWQHRALFDADGAVTEYQGTGIDITERKQTERALRESEIRFRGVIEGSMQGIMVHRDFKPLFCNPAYARIYGFAGVGEVLAHESLLDLVPEDRRDKVIEQTKRLMAGREPSWQDRVRRLRRDGRTIWCDVQARRVVWEGEPAVQITTIDVTEEKVFSDELQASRRDLEQQAAELSSLARGLEEAKREADDQRVRAEAASQAKSNFLATMSHELRTPLNAILGFSEILRDQVFGPIGKACYADYANDIYESGGHLLELINDVLDLSKIEAGKLTIEPIDVDLGALIESSLRLVSVRAQEAGLALQADLPSQPLFLHADPRALKQIAYNLLSNSIKFTPSGGRVCVAARREDDGSVVLEVRDNGKGISARDLRRVMQPYEQVENSFGRSAAEGTGLGLSMVTGLAELHGAQVEMASEPGQGTTVTVRFPQEAEPSS